MLSPDELIDHFRVKRLLGKGGMGEVYLARDTKLGRRVALKMVNPERLGSRENVERFLFEARTTAQFNHPHIVTVFAAGEHNGSPYIALEYLEGQNLRQRMREGQPTLREALRLGLAIAEALAEAHGHSVLHRDLKPENVLLPRDGRLRVIDFGLAQVMSDEVTDLPTEELQQAQTLIEASIDGAALDGLAFGRDAPPPGEAHDTVPGRHQTDAHSRQGVEASGDDLRRSIATVGDKIIGTPSYMAPEQWMGKENTPATDIWALGLILYELLSNERPYHVPTPLALATQVVAPEPVPSIENHVHLAPDLVELVSRCLAKRPEHRLTAARVVEELEGMVHRGRVRTTSEQSPFRGLLPFSERHADLFFGRDDEIAAFVERVREEPVLPVVGPSGAGKSSFIQAGIIPRLREQGPWVVLSIRPGDRPFRNLASRLLVGESTAHSSTPDGPRTVEMRIGATESEAGDERTDLTTVEDEGSLARQLLEHPRVLGLRLARVAEEEGTRLLLVVDQLEELYTLVDDEQVRQRFMQAICTAADDPDGPVRVVFSLRDDYLGRLAYGSEVREALGRLTVIRSPGPAGLEEVLVKPLAAVSYSFDDPSLPKEMVASVQGEPACLPLLQFAAQTLWNRRDREELSLRRDAYTAMGGVAGALAEHADGVLIGLSSQQLRVARELLLRLVTSEGTRRVLPRNQALEGLGDEAEEVLDRLSKSRLVSVRKAGRDEGVEASLELVHESLIRSWGRLARWVEESREEISFLVDAAQAAELWQKRGESDEEVWSGVALMEAERHLERCTCEVPVLVTRFIDAGRRLARRRTRTRRLRIISIMGVLALVALGATTAAFTLSRQNQEVIRQRAESQRDEARRAMEQGDLMEARTKLRAALEVHDSALGRLLWWRVAQNPVVWRRSLGANVNDLAFSPEGDTLAAASADRAIYLIDARSQAIQRVLRGHRDQVTAVAFSPDGRQIASGAWDGEVRLWPAAPGPSKVLRTAQPGGAWGVAFSPDGRHLAAASADGHIYLWLTQSGEPVAVLDGHQDEVQAVAFDPRGRFLASAGNDHRVRLWDARSWKPWRVLEGHTATVLSLDFSPDGRTLASGGDDKTVRLWDVDRAASRRELKGHTANVRSLCFSPDGTHLASGGDLGRVLLWEVKSGQLMQPVVERGDTVSAVRFSPEGRSLAVGGYDRAVELRAVDRMVTATRDIGHESAVYGVAFAPDDRTLVSGGRDNTVRLWEVESGHQLQVMSSQAASLQGVDVSPDGELVAAGTEEGTVLLWQRASGQRLAVLSGHPAQVWDVAFSPSGKTLATAGDLGDIRLWELPSGRLRHVLEGHTESVYGLGFSPDGTLLASGSRDKSARVWDVASGELKLQLTGHSEAVEGVRFTPDGKSLLSGSDDRTIRRWDLASGTGQLVAEQPGRVYWIDVHPDGRRVGAPSSDQTARIWDLETGSFVELRGHTGEVNYLRFSHDGRLAVTSSDDGTVRLWETETGAPYWRAPLLLPAPARLYSHRGWRALDPEGGDAPAPTPSERWRRAVEARAREASVDAADGALCLVTFDGAVELWSLGTDERRWIKRLGAAPRAVALSAGCLVISEGRALLIDRDGAERELVSEGASAAAYVAPDLLLAAGPRVLVLAPDGELRRSYSADVGITTLTQGPDWIVLGYADGNVELISRKSGERRSSFSLKGVPSSPVTGVLCGGQQTLIAGYANGLLGIWDLHGGERLHHARLHGKVRHLLLERGRLFAATELGSYMSWDLRVLSQERCALMRAVWAAVPLGWESGQAIALPPPDDHPCAGTL